MEFNAECHRFRTGELLSACNIALKHFGKIIQRGNQDWNVALTATVWFWLNHFYSIGMNETRVWLMIKWMPVKLCECHTVESASEMKRHHKCTAVKISLWIILWVKRLFCVIKWIDKNVTCSERWKENFKKRIECQTKFVGNELFLKYTQHVNIYYSLHVNNM